MDTAPAETVKRCRAAGHKPQDDLGRFFPFVPYGVALCVLEIWTGERWSDQDLWNILDPRPRLYQDRPDWRATLETTTFRQGTFRDREVVPRWYGLGDLAPAALPDPYPFVDILGVLNCKPVRLQLQDREAIVREITLERRRTAGADFTAQVAETILAGSTRNRARIKKADL
jgi:hypothetical protein